MSFESKPGLWIQATSNLSGAFWNQILRENQTVYNIDFSQARGTALLDEVVVTANRPKPKPAPAPVQPMPKSWLEKNKLWIMIGSGVLVTTIAIIIIVGSRKNKDK